MSGNRPAACLSCPPEPVEHLTAVVRQALDQPDLALDFVRAGGNSLVALTLARTAQLHGFRLGIQALLRAPSLHHLVHEAATALPTVARAKRPTGRAPLLPFQRWMRRLDQAAAADLAVVSRWRSSHPVDPWAVDEALRALPALHDALRTRIRPAGDGSARQEETGHPMLDVEVVADGSTPPTDVPALVAAARRRLDPYAGPSTVATVLADPAGGPTELLLVTQHAVSDVVSHEILMTEVEAILAGEDPARLGEATSSHQWARLLERYQTSDEILAERGYWQDVLRRSWRGPYARNETVVGGGSGRRVSAGLPAPQRAAVGALRRTLGLTPTELMLMAVGQVFGDGRRHLLVGMSTHGRYPAFDGVELHSTVGWLSANVAVAVPPVDTDPVRWRDHLRAELAEIPHHGIGVFGAEWVRPPDELTRLLAAVTPLISLNVVHVAHRPERRWHLRRRTGQGPVVCPRGPAVRLVVVVHDGPDEEVRLSMDYNDAYFAEAAATGIVDALAAAPAELAKRLGAA